MNKRQKNLHLSGSKKAGEKAQEPKGVIGRFLDWLAKGNEKGLASGKICLT